MIRSWAKSPYFWAALILQLVGVLIAVHFYNLSRSHLTLQMKLQKEAKLTFEVAHISESFSLIRDALRTISTLPSIRKISGQNAQLKADERVTVQMLYNTLANHVSVSELYIVPVNFDPESKTQIAPTTFDGTILGKNLDNKTNNKEDEELEEIEIFEYREMRAQIDTFRKIASQMPDKQPSPMLISNEVITCDNSEFSTQLLEANDNRSRTGFVLSVPFYGLSNQLAGIVSAVVRTKQIEAFLEQPGVQLNLQGRNQKYLLPRSSPNLEDESIWRIQKPLDKNTLDGAKVIVDLTLNELETSKEYQGELKSILFMSVIFEMLLLLLLGTVFGFSLIERSRLQEKTRIEQARLLRASEETQKLKHSIVANVSHEIRTPINGIVGLVELLNGSKLDDNQRGQLSLIKDSTQHLLKVLADLLSYSDIESERLELHSKTIQLNSLIEEVVADHKLQSQHLGLNLKTTSNQRELVVVTDRDLLKQILSQLVKNSLKFTKEGQIEVITRVTNQSLTHADIEIAVKDSGPGISEDDQTRIFQPFEQIDSSSSRKFGGTGLGLYIAQRRAKAIGGSIRLTSEIGKGSTFTLAVRLELVQPIEKATAPNLPSIEKLKILVVDDNPINLMVLSKYISKLGGNADSAVNGAEAVTKASTGQYDLIFMDCQMPVLDGFEATKQIRQLTQLKFQPVIAAVTANVSDYDKQICFDAGMDAFFSKPITINQISEYINSLQKPKQQQAA